MATVEINEAIFCQPHIQEVCEDCGFDGREENDAFYGLQSIDREPLQSPSVSQAEDGSYRCKQHGSPFCNQCFGWKKQLVKLQRAAKAAGKG